MNAVPAKVAGVDEIIMVVPTPGGEVNNMVLAAASLGYGTCWIGAFKDEDVKAVCGIPDDLTVVACSPLGVPEVHPPARQRKEWNEVFSRDRFGEPLNI